MVVPSGIRYLARWRFALLRYQPPMETGEADLLYSSIASSRGSMECERTSLTTTLSSGRKLLSPGVGVAGKRTMRSEEHTSELQSLTNLVCRLLLEKKKKKLTKRRRRKIYLYSGRGRSLMYR